MAFEETTGRDLVIYVGMGIGVVATVLVRRPLGKLYECLNRRTKAHPVLATVIAVPVAWIMLLLVTFLVRIITGDWCP